MAENIGTQIIAPIVTPNSNDKFPTHINNCGKGGYHSVQSLVDRDKIPNDRREEGMLCGVIAENVVYQLRGGIDNAFWEIFTTGAGGATSASSLNYSPTGDLKGTTVQEAVDELESKKANINDIYTKAETDNLVKNQVIDYDKLQNKPDLSSLHSHTNLPTLNKFTEVMGELHYAGKSIGNMVADVFDVNKDGIIDEAATLSGMTTSVDMLNYTKGLTGNIQSQINAISLGTVFKGEYDTYAEMQSAIPTPQKGYWVFIVTDETKSDAKTQYYHDGTEWIYGGGSSSVPNATDTVTGGIKLAGVLDNPNGTSDNPLLNATGVVAGLYNAPKIQIEEDGRISHVEEGKTAFINDGVVSESETWSSTKLNEELFKKASANHTHTELHASNVIGDIELDTTSRADKKVITYNASSGKAEWKDPLGGKVYVGSKVIAGDFRLVAGSYVNLFIDEAAKTVTINCTAQNSGGGSVPTLTEITETINVPSGSSVFVSLDAAFNKYDIRTLEAFNDTGAMIEVEVYDQAENGRRVYYSNREKHIYDIVNVPCHDKDQTKMIHLKINNYDTSDTNVSLNINTTNLI